MVQFHQCFFRTCPHAHANREKGENLRGRVEVAQNAHAPGSRSGRGTEGSCVGAWASFAPLWSAYFNYFLIHKNISARALQPTCPRAHAGPFKSLEEKGLMCVGKLFVQKNAHAHFIRYSQRRTSVLVISRKSHFTGVFGKKCPRRLSK
jgi:hypothetical protein